VATAVSVAFKRAGKTYDFDSDGLELALSDRVVVRTTRGMELGDIVAVREAAEGEDLKKVIRRANADDLQFAEDLRVKEEQARRLAARRVSELGMAMKLVEVEYVFDGSKALFYFTAEERVDFRELVKELTDELKVKIEMRQIGVRDEAKMIGGLGPCGERLCCSVFAGDFEPVSIRMAKEQDLPLNPQKISGVCGRLMCCLKYEVETYKDFKKRAPKRGANVSTCRGCGVVTDFQVPRDRVVVRLEEGGTVAVTLDELEGKAPPAVLEAEGPAERERPPERGRPAERESQRQGRSRSRRTAEPAATAEPAPKAEKEPSAAGGEAERVPVKRRRRRRRKRSTGGDGAV
jgi:cell fate regulator YaaT (PSP1 superfamily)